ncbi:MAG TPA: hypothetical protein VF189_05330 [Patescibacteria group bacterium]
METLFLVNRPTRKEKLIERLKFAGTLAAILTPTAVGILGTILLKDTTLLQHANITFVDTQAHNVNYVPNFTPGSDFYNTQATTNVDLSWLNTAVKAAPTVVGIGLSGLAAKFKASI